MKLALLALAIALLMGCGLFDGFKPSEIVKHPDAPMLIVETESEWVRVAVFSAAEVKLVDAGWVKLDDLVGWTISKYDWEKFIVERRNP